MAKQLEMFPKESTEPIIPKEELKKLKALALSQDQANIDLCFDLLGMYNYTPIDRAVFIFNQHLCSVSEKEWIEDAHAGGEYFETTFNIKNNHIIIKDGSFGYSLYLKVSINLKEYIIWDYLYYEGSFPNKPTRKKQMKKMRKVFEMKLNK